jgi:hypothetical protein
VQFLGAYTEKQGKGCLDPLQNGCFSGPQPAASARPEKKSKKNCETVKHISKKPVYCKRIATANFFQATLLIESDARASRIWRAEETLLANR